MRGFQSEMERDMKLEQDMLRQCEGELIHAPRGSLACYVKKGRIYFKHVYYLRGGGDKKSVRMERHLGKEDEALIANSLHENRIVFFYEKEMRVTLEKGETVILHPDFAILLPSGELILWEHLGLLRKKEYALKFGEKLHFYNLAGYTLGVNLILTADDANGSLDMQAVARIIDWLKTICQKR